jgi:L-serine dehydratase
MDSISVFEIIKVGIGPSSSHTMGPWNAAEYFIDYLKQTGVFEQLKSVQVHLFGSLAKTGVGHGTDLAVVMGLAGENFRKIDTQLIPDKLAKIKNDKVISAGGSLAIGFDFEKDIVFHFKESLPFHPNGIRFTGTLSNGEEISREYFSVGGGFVITENDTGSRIKKIVCPYPCHSALTIVDYCKKMNLSVSELIMLNEKAWRTEEEIKQAALNIFKEIKEAIFRGINTPGILPGGLNVKRRSAELNRKLLGDLAYTDLNDWILKVKMIAPSFSNVNKWVSCFALAVNEENAAFGRIITAPTNGASGVLPAVMMYAYLFTEDFTEEKAIRFILTAGELGTLFKKNATISAAMGGCQAEVGVSSAMSAGALVEILGGTPEQVLMAAEIAMEHHLGLTCDPIGGLVQIPCIERNSMGAIKAITAANIAIESDPSDAKVSLDAVIKSMWETALDMNNKYKETSEGGLAVNVPVNVAEC